MLLRTTSTARETTIRSTRAILCLVQATARRPSARVPADSSIRREAEVVTCKPARRPEQDRRSWRPARSLAREGGRRPMSRLSPPHRALHRAGVAGHPAPPPPGKAPVCRRSARNGFLSVHVDENPSTCTSTRPPPKAGRVMRASAAAPSTTSPRRCGASSHAAPVSCARARCCTSGCSGWRRDAAGHSSRPARRPTRGR